MSKFIDQTLHVAENLRAHSPLDIIWHPWGGVSPVKNHWFNLMYKVVGFITENILRIKWNVWYIIAC